jgi:class 3 adenylate cyclase
MSQSIAALEERTAVDALIAFADLTGYSAQAARVGDEEVAAVLDGFYELVGGRVAAAGGTLVKFIGDAALAVFGVADADRGVAALLELKAEADAYFAARGWPCRLEVKIHRGEVIAGPFGAAGAKRFDVIGKQVNTCAMLDSTGVALSVEAFRSLSPPLRQRFKKHTWPVTYIRAEDPHRFRRR